MQKGVEKSWIEKIAYLLFIIAAVCSIFDGSFFENKLLAGNKNTDTQICSNINDDEIQIPLNIDNGKKNYVRIVAESLEIRSDSNKRSEVIGSAQPGEVYLLKSTVFRVNGEKWFCISVDKHNGFVPADDVEIIIE